MAGVPLDVPDRAGPGAGAHADTVLHAGDVEGLGVAADCRVRCDEIGGRLVEDNAHFLSTRQVESSRAGIERVRRRRAVLLEDRVALCGHHQRRADLVRRPVRPCRAQQGTGAGVVRAGHRGAAQELVFRRGKCLAVRLGGKDADTRSADVRLQDVYCDTGSAGAEARQNVAVCGVEAQRITTDRTDGVSIGGKPGGERGAVRLGNVHAG